MIEPKDIVVRCGDCGWQGPVKDLRHNDADHYCPKCGREFSHFPSQAQSMVKRTSLQPQQPACNHDLQSKDKTLKATMAPRYGWRCTTCNAEWYPSTSSSPAPI